MADQTHPALQALLDEVQAVVRRAFADGYRHGTHEAIDRMSRAASYGADARLPGIIAPPSPRPETRTQSRMSPPRIGVPGRPREYQYGSVIGLCRQALLAAPGTGITKEELLQFVRDKGTDATPNQIKDIIKRLIGGEEVERHDGMLYPGRRLRPFVENDSGQASMLRSENGNHPDE